MWRSLVARVVRDDEVAGSNPVIPTNDPLVITIRDGKGIFSYRKAAVTTPHDRRYEKHVPAVNGQDIRRSHDTWHWRDSQVHLDRVGAPDAPVRILLVHGAGGNSDAFWPYAAHFASLGAHVTVPDLPGYGMTVTDRPERIRYDDWRELLIDLLRAEEDERPLIILGASMGGLLAYDAAAATGLAARLIVTCLLDPRDPRVRARLTWHPLLARLTGPFLKLVQGPPANLRVPIRWIADIRHISNDPGLVREVVRDRRGGGGRVPLGWIRSYMESAPLIEPEDFTDTPVLLLHPGDDRWTPLEISRPFFERIGAQKSWRLLENAGHFPVEEPGFEQMMRAVKHVMESTHD